MTVLLLGTALQSVSSYTSEYNTVELSLEKGAYIVEYNNEKLKIEQIAPKSSVYKFTLKNNVIAISSENNCIYILSRSKNQKNIYFLNTFNNGNLSEQQVIFDVKLNSESPLFSVDNNGNFYVSDKNKKLQYVNDCKGRIVEGAFAESLFSLDSIVYYTNNGRVYQLDQGSAVKSYDFSNAHIGIRISDNYISNENGQVYRNNNGLFKVNITLSYPELSCEAGDYIVSYGKNNLIAYNKYNGNFANKYYIGFTPKSLLSYNNKILTINKSLNTESYEADKLFDTQSQNEKPDNNKLSFGNYKVKGKYIFTNSGLTISKFKKSIVYDSYEINFSKKSGNIGTGTEVTFGKGSKTLRYTFVVKGDLTGEGNINSRDLRSMFKHLLNEENLKGAYKLAADMNNDRKISNADLVLLDKKFS